MNPLNFKAIRGKAPGDQYSDDIDAAEANSLPVQFAGDPLDSEEAREERR